MVIRKADDWFGIIDIFDVEHPIWLQQLVMYNETYTCTVEALNAWSIQITIADGHHNDQVMFFTPAIAASDWSGNAVPVTVNQQTTVIDDRLDMEAEAFNFSQGWSSIIVDDPTDVPLPSSYTVSVHFIAPLCSTGYWPVLCADDNNEAICVRGYTDGNLGIINFTTGAFADSGASVQGLDAGWHHLLVRCTGGSSSFYIDGVFVGTAADMLVGNLKQINGNDTYTYSFSSGLDAFRLYNYAILTEDIPLLGVGSPYDHHTGTAEGVVDAGSDVYWYKLDYLLSLPGGSNAVVKVRTCLDEDGDEGLSPKDWITVTRGTLGMMRGRWMQWRVEFTAGMMDYCTPRLYRLDFEYETQTYNHAADTAALPVNSVVYDTYSDWRDCPEFDMSPLSGYGPIDIETSPGDIMPTVDMTYNHAAITRIVDAGRDISWGFYEIALTYPEGAPGGVEVQVYFRSTTEAEGEAALSGKSWEGNQQYAERWGPIPSGVPNGRYLQWRLNLFGQYVHPDAYKPVVHKMTLWLCPGKAFYYTADHWTACTLDNVVADGDTAILYSLVGHYADTGTVEDTVDAGSDVSWSYLMYSVTASQGTSVAFHYKYATEAEGSAALDDKDWTPLGNTNIYSISARYMRWRATLSANRYTNLTPVLRRVMLGFGDAEEFDLTVPSIADANMGKLEARLLGSDDTHSDELVLGSYTGTTGVDSAVTTVSLAPVVQWDNIAASGEPAAIRYLFNLFTEDNKNAADQVYEFSKMGDTDFADYAWKMDTVEVGADGITLNDRYELGGAIRYLLDAGSQMVWRRFKADDNSTHYDDSIRVTYFIRFSVGGTYWTDWQQVRPGDFLLEASRYAEVRVVLRRNSGLVIPVVNYLAVEAWSGGEFYILDTGEDGTTSMDLSVRDQLVDKQYYYYRVKAFDGANLSLWSRTRVMQASATLYQPYGAYRYRVSGSDPYTFDGDYTYYGLYDFGGVWGEIPLWLRDGEDIADPDASVIIALSKTTPCDWRIGSMGGVVTWLCYYTVDPVSDPTTATWSGGGPPWPVVVTALEAFLFPAPTDLKTDGQTNPTHVVSFSPDLTWTFEDAFGSTQQHARIQVGKASGVWDVWDSGKTPTVTGLTYGTETDDTWMTARVLEEGKSYVWHVRTWNDLSLSSPFSAIATFSLNIRPTRPDLLSVYPYASSSSSSSPPPSSSGSGDQDEDSPNVPKDGMTLWLRASNLKANGWKDGDQVSLWEDKSGQMNHAYDGVPITDAPIFHDEVINYSHQPAVLFSSISPQVQRRAMAVDAQLITPGEHREFCVCVVMGLKGNQQFGSENNIALGSTGTAGVGGSLKVGTTSYDNWDGYLYFSKKGSETEYPMTSNGLFITSYEYRWYGVFYQFVYNEHDDRYENRIKITWFNLDANWFDNPLGLQPFMGDGRKWGIGCNYQNVGFEQTTDEFYGYIAEMMVWDRALTWAEEGNVSSYLNDKFNLGMYMPV
jgi:hypothetical protein